MILPDKKRRILYKNWPTGQSPAVYSGPPTWPGGKSCQVKSSQAPLPFLNPNWLMLTLSSAMSACSMSLVCIELSEIGL